LYETIGIGALATVEALLFGINNGEQCHGRDAETDGLLEFLEQTINTMALDAGHRRHGFRPVFALQHKHGIYEIAGAETGFGDETAERRRPAAATHANIRELSWVTGTHRLDDINTIIFYFPRI
jgi:hypothetical protein